MACFLSAPAVRSSRSRPRHVAFVVLFDGETALFGRTRQLAVLGDLVAAGRSCLVRGEAGIGKTALIRAAVTRADRPVLAGRGVEALRTVPSLPLWPVVRDLPSVAEPADLVALVHTRQPRAFLVVEDLQWCDVDTLAALEELCLSFPIVASVRPESPGCEALVARLAEIGDVMSLGPLNDEDARRVVDLVSPGAPPSD